MSIRESGNHKIILGVTGLLGSGKSTVTEIFSEYGAYIIDTDTISHQLTSKGGEAIGPIKEKFGEGYIITDGGLDREKMRGIIFYDDKKKIILENILHQLIYQRVLGLLKQINNKYIAIVVPLLFKCPEYLKLINYSLFIDCEEALLIQRVKKRSNLPCNMIKRILSTQMPREEQIKLADYVIANNSLKIDLRKKVAELCSEICFQLSTEN